MEATTLVYVRTEAGTVRLHEGDTVPDSANVEHVEQLTADGLLVQEKPRRSRRGETLGAAEGKTDPA